MDKRTGNALAHKRLLVIDDSRTFCSLLRSIMRDIGVRDITDIVDPHLALEYLDTNPVDCITVDYMMPGMDGLDLVSRLRASPTSVNRLAPVMLITGHADVRLIQNAVNAGVNEILVKPLRPSTFTERLSRTLTGPERGKSVAPTHVGADRRRKADSGYEGEERRASAIQSLAVEGRAASVVPMEKACPDMPACIGSSQDMFLID